VKDEVYDLRSPDDLSSFDFVSVGKNGRILKRISFKSTETENAYNLSFGDVTETNRINDSSISNNGDRNKILATVASAVDQFTKRYPWRTVYFVGRTDARNRLYRMAINLRWKELSAKYLIYADADSEDGWVPFQKNMKINAISIVRKAF
jgi:hypothetical protein